MDGSTGKEGKREIAWGGSNFIAFWNNREVCYND